MANLDIVRPNRLAVASLFDRIAVLVLAMAKVVDFAGTAWNRYRKLGSLTQCLGDFERWLRTDYCCSCWGRNCCLVAGSRADLVEYRGRSRRRLSRCFAEGMAET